MEASPPPSLRPRGLPAARSGSGETERGRWKKRRRGEEVPPVSPVGYDAGAWQFFVVYDELVAYNKFVKLRTSRIISL